MHFLGYNGNCNLANSKYEIIGLFRGIFVSKIDIKKTSDGNRNRRGI